jgi:hypothetical protein
MINGGKDSLIRIDGPCWRKMPVAVNELFGFIADHR